MAALLSTPLDKYDVVTGALTMLRRVFGGGLRWRLKCGVCTQSASPLRCTVNAALAPPAPPRSTPLSRRPVLGLGHFPSVMELLQPRMKREMAGKIVQARGWV